MSFLKKVVDKIGNFCAAPNSQNRRPKEEKETRRNLISKMLNNSGNSTSSVTVLEDAIHANFSTKYKLYGQLGRGSFGVTFLCKELETGTRYACKAIKKKNLTTKHNLDCMRREVQVMRHLPPNPNIACMKEVYEDDKNIYIITELCKGGELFDRIVAQFFYKEKEAVVIFKTIVEVVQFLHQHGVMHGDLKPENILFSDSTESATIKLIDFGFSRFFTPGQQFHDMIGSLYYMSPDVLIRSFGSKADIWSLGVILYNLLSGDYPFLTGGIRETQVAIIESEIKFDKYPWMHVSEPAKDLVRKILDRNPNTRPSAEEILAHEWFKIFKRKGDKGGRANIKSKIGGGGN